MSSNNAWWVSSVSKVLNWARSNSLWYLPFSTGCCGNEFTETNGCRYDLERFGCVIQQQPEKGDLLIINGAVTYKLVEEVQSIYERMLFPKYVLAIGSCACCGGAFSPEMSYSVVPGVDRFLPVDVYVPGCPPRPEAIMNGLIVLQEKISGNRSILTTN